ncbi:MAG: malonyl-ACP O-methyltransferase BioC [Endozoicomonas sp. (ex Botrylloides leachii)]|nr:malonyl-ACP O-methyltransferase BioC [Endozoicomonas sp. (ex Botrylloides leachii)]
MSDAITLIKSPTTERLPIIRFKKRIAKHFGEASSTYDAKARLQRRIAARTTMLIPPEKRPLTIVDLGSGTGQHTKELARIYPEALVTGIDIAQGMVNYARITHSSEANNRWLVGDIEQLPFRNQSVDVVFSSLAIQWCNLQRILHEVKRVLKKNGCFVFSSLAKGTLQELQTAWRLVDEGCHTNSFLSFAEQKCVLHRSRLKHHSFLSQVEQQFYPDLYSLLKELKALGVNTVSSPVTGLMTRKKLNALEIAYEALRQHKGLPLSYQVVYGHFEQTQL